LRLLELKQRKRSDEFSEESAPDKSESITAESLNLGNLHWLTTNLCAPNSNIESFPLMFPDTVFLKNGCFVELIRSDVNTGTLESIKQESKLAPDVIIRSFNTAVKERRKYVNKSKLTD